PTRPLLAVRGRPPPHAAAPSPPYAAAGRRRRSCGQSCRWGGTGGRSGTPAAPGRAPHPRTHAGHPAGAGPRDRPRAHTHAG
ncbi:hypothetical protein PFZ55_53685, partial [Streptomyces sp. MS2A]|nr:hypothetical protein [Streptomyces sp. MS2A]